MRSISKVVEYEYLGPDDMERVIDDFNDDGWSLDSVAPIEEEGGIRLSRKRVTRYLLIFYQEVTV